MYLLLADVPVVAQYQLPQPQIIQAIRPGTSRVFGPPVVEDPDFSLLRKIIPGDSD